VPAVGGSISIDRTAERERKSTTNPPPHDDLHRSAIDNTTSILCNSLVARQALISTFGRPFERTRPQIRVFTSTLGVPRLRIYLERRILWQKTRARIISHALFYDRVGVDPYHRPFATKLYRLSKYALFEFHGYITDCTIAFYSTIRTLLAME
jgi:hypothetical protein